MKKFWILFFSELMAGSICTAFLLNIKFWIISGSKIAYFNILTWMTVIFLLIWYAIYHSPYANKLKEGKK